MPLKRSGKEALEQEYQSMLDQSSGLLVFEYHRLKVDELNDLRNKVRDAGSTLRIVKNSMLILAAKEKEFAPINPILLGPNAVIFAGKDPVAPAKILMEFAKTHEAVKIKGGVVSGKFLNPGEVEKLSKIPSKEVIYSKILGGIKAPASNVLGCIKGIHQKLHGLVKARIEQMEKAA